MDIIIRNLIVDILNQNKDLLKIAVRKKAKFEGWLKFELARSLEKNGYQEVCVESKFKKSKGRADITFKDGFKPYGVELKTPNTNWKIKGVSDARRPITKNISSIIHDVKKLNSAFGIVAFVLFPVPLNNLRWHKYIKRINDETGLKISTTKDCDIVNINHESNNACTLVVCATHTNK